jgi:hypothetical protein
MIIWLHPRLADHRRGRFLATELHASVARDGDLGELPGEGMMLMIGKDFQLQDEAGRNRLLAWCGQPGRSLVLLPPYQVGELQPGLDWRVGLRDAAPEATGVAVVDAVRGEASFELHGRDGGFSSEAGQQWPDFGINTRFWKQHTGSGVFAATCLPLWSISLLGKGAAVSDWLLGIHRLAGAPTVDADDALNATAAEALQATDYAVMVCIFGWREPDPQRLMKRVAAQPLPVVELEPGRLAKATEGLRAAGMLAATGLSERGEAALRASPYWGYAQSLREEVS